MNQKYSINLLPVSVTNQEIEVHYTNTEIADAIRLRKSLLPLTEQGGIIEEWVFISTNPIKAGKSFLLDPKHEHYYSIFKILMNNCLLLHFKEKFIVSQNFIGTPQVWMPKGKNGDWEVFDRFSLKMENHFNYPDFHITLSYENESSVHLQEFKNSGISAELVTEFILGNKVLRRQENTAVPDDSRVKLNKGIERNFISRGIVKKRNPFRNIYKEYYDAINTFANDQLRGKTFGNFVKAFDTGFHEISPKKLLRIPSESNLLEFGGNIKNFKTIDGLKQGGPYRKPPIENVKVIFIFRALDRDYANKLYLYLKKGYRNFPGLESFAQIKFSLEKENSIALQSSTTSEMVSEISEKLNGLTDMSEYLAFFITPTTKEEDRDNDDPLYPEIKRVLLEHGVTSQFIERHKLDDHNYNFFLTNIGLATIAKLRGIPWRLPFQEVEDLVIGFGAYRPKKTDTVYIGNAVCFKNDGTFEEFHTFPADQLKNIGLAFKSYIEGFVRAHGSCRRIIIHYFKAVGKTEKTQIKSVLERLDLNIPYFFVTVTETDNDLIFFDESYDGKMPISGSILRLSKNTFLLCNNTRYSESTATKIEGYPLPIKVRIDAYDDSLLNNREIMQELTEQVYQFSRLYWKSVRQKSLPVTIEYSKILAKLTSNFPDSRLPNTQITRNTLWFL